MYVLRRRRCSLSFEGYLRGGFGGIAFIEKSDLLAVYNTEDKVRILNWKRNINDNTVFFAPVLHDA